jgi:uncharacterized protein YigA (DUF484 family)
MTERTDPSNTELFTVLSTIARRTTTTSDLYDILNAALHTSLSHLPLTGAVVWLGSDEHDVLTPGISRVPADCATSAIAIDSPLVQRVMDSEHLLLEGAEAQNLMLLPHTTALVLAPIRSPDVLLGLLGYIGERASLARLTGLLEASAGVLSSVILSTWLRRQQQEADDVAATLFQFAGELRAQRSLEDILGTLNNLALRVFNCDWSAVYHWQESSFAPVQIMTRVGEQDVSGEPALVPGENPLLEMTVNDPQLLSVRDLREQPGALPAYVQRHSLRGVVLVPLQKTASHPLGLLALGYRAPLTTLNSRATALAQGLARMVAIALERTMLQTQGEPS